MKKLSFLLFLIVTPLFYAQDIVGDWYGAINVSGIELPLVFHISRTDSSYSSTMDSPKQQVSGIPMSSTSFNGYVLTIKHKESGIFLEAKIGEDDFPGGFKGYFEQNGMSFPILLADDPELAKAPIPNRPQTPKAPFPYEVREITFQNKKARIQLSGTLTLPEGKGQKFPAVILITGSGPQNRNSEIFDHKSFWLIADYFTRRGIAVLRYDERGVGESEGEFQKATSRDFANDVQAAFDFLRKQKGIDKHKIGLIGHSEGGLIAPIVASEDKRIAFIILMAGPGIRSDLLLLQQQNDIAEINGVSLEERESMGQLNRGIMDLILANPEKNDLSKEMSEFAGNFYDQLPEEQKEKEYGKDRFVKTLTTAYNTPWMLYFIRHNPEPYLKALKCDVLALNGTKDLQVAAYENLHAIDIALQDIPEIDYEIVYLKDLNHLFQHCETGAISEYAKIEETLAPEILEKMEQWIKSRK
ncbi:MAG: alpha/beta fold hydrolase [Bacteroidetes bacterium]|nr:MAG: alpha/beta fold hydrolase [Bacteroidota bacterium]